MPGGTDSVGHACQRAHWACGQVLAPRMGLRMERKSCSADRHHELTARLAHVGNRSEEGMGRHAGDEGLAGHPDARRPGSRRRRTPRRTRRTACVSTQSDEVCLYGAGETTRAVSEARWDPVRLFWRSAAAKGLAAPRGSVCVRDGASARRSRRVRCRRREGRPCPSYCCRCWRC